VPASHTSREQYLASSGRLMRPSAVAYVLFLCDRPKPHATPMQVQGHTALVLLTMGQVSHPTSCRDTTGEGVQRKWRTKKKKERKKERKKKTRQEEKKVYLVPVAGIHNDCCRGELTTIARHGYFCVAHLIRLFL
jgi:hypothetical protein